MRVFIGFIIFTCLAFPGFSQNARSQRVKALSDSMGTAVTRGTATLADFDSRTGDDGQIKVYTDYRRKFGDLSKAMQDSEDKLNFLLRTNDRARFIKEERDNYDDLLKQLQTMKSDYDTWLRTVQ